MTNLEIAEHLVDYIKRHPQERFFQAVLNMFNFPYLLISNHPPEESGQHDTFFIEDSEFSISKVKPATLTKEIHK